MIRLHRNLQFTLQFPQVVSWVQFYLIYMQQNYHPVQTPIQYADDTIISRTRSSDDILQKLRKLENDIRTVSEWPAGNGLYFNNGKLKYITFSSKRKVNDKNYLIHSNRKSIAEETTVKLLGVKFNQNVVWSSHVNSIVKTSYGILQTLKTLNASLLSRYICPWQSLVLSRLNYSNVVFGQLPKYFCTKQCS